MKAHHNFALTQEDKKEIITSLVDQGKTEEEIADVLYFAPLIREFVSLVGIDAASAMTQDDFEVFYLYPNKFQDELNKLRGIHYGNRIGDGSKAANE